MQRDKRLLAAIALHTLLAIAAAYQVIMLVHWMNAAVLGDWVRLAEIYSVDPPAAGPDHFCFAWCAPDLSFVAGWLGMASFVSAFALAAWARGRPKG